MHNLQGHFLIAAPTLRDPNFNRSIILLVQHNEDGALGLVLNRPLGATIDAIWQQVKGGPGSADGEGETVVSCPREDPVFQGGPCEGILASLHGRESLSEVEVVPGVHFSMNRDAIEELVESVGASPVKFFVGYAGWGPGQLEGEVREGAWLALPASSEQVFEPAEDLWTLLVRALGAAAARPTMKPSMVPADPSVN